MKTIKQVAVIFISLAFCLIFTTSAQALERNKQLDAVQAGSSTYTYSLKDIDLPMLEIINNKERILEFLQKSDDLSIDSKIEQLQQFLVLIETYQKSVSNAVLKYQKFVTHLSALKNACISTTNMILNMPEALAELDRISKDQCSKNIEEMDVYVCNYARQLDDANLFIVPNR